MFDWKIISFSLTLVKSTYTKAFIPKLTDYFIRVHINGKNVWGKKKKKKLDRRFQKHDFGL